MPAPDPCSRHTKGTTRHGGGAPDACGDAPGSVVARRTVLRPATSNKGRAGLDHPPRPLRLWLRGEPTPVGTDAGRAGAPSAVQPRLVADSDLRRHVATGSRAAQSVSLPFRRCTESPCAQPALSRLVGYTAGTGVRREALSAAEQRVNGSLRIAKPWLRDASSPDRRRSRATPRHPGLRHRDRRHHPPEERHRWRILTNRVRASPSSVRRPDAGAPRHVDP